MGGAVIASLKCPVSMSSNSSAFDPGLARGQSHTGRQTGRGGGGRASTLIGETYFGGTEPDEKPKYEGFGKGKDVCAERGNGALPA